MLISRIDYLQLVTPQLMMVMVPLIATGTVRTSPLPLLGDNMVLQKMP
jgi:hypothetical protein